MAGILAYCSSCWLFNKIKQYFHTTIRQKTAIKSIILVSFAR